tara:strand:- start:168 stop:1799 length:1632 start_codon:yes stop_codon:yes gene_type:complete
MAEQDYRKKREKLLSKEQQFRSQGKTELANKMNRIDISRMNTPDGQLPVEARNIARNVQITDEQRQIQKLPTASIDETRGAITQRFTGESTSPGNIAQPKLLADAAQEKLLKSLQDSKGDWYIKGKNQKKLFQSHAVSHIRSHADWDDPREGLNKVFVWDDNLNDYDEKLVRDYQKVATGEKDNIVLNSKKLDLRKKADRNWRLSPDTKSVQDFAASIGDPPELVEKWLMERGAGSVISLKQSKKLSAESQKLGGDKVETGHEVSLTTDVGEGKKPSSSQYTYFDEPFQENRGTGQKGGSSKTINLKIAAGQVPRHDIEDYEMFKEELKFRETGETKTLRPIKEEYTPAEQRLLRALPANHSAADADELTAKIDENRVRIQKRTGIKLTSGTKTKLNAKGLYRNIAKAAGQSNNPLVNVSGDIVGAVMDGVAFAANPSQQNSIDLALSGSQAVLSLAALGLAAVPIPGGRPGAFMLMKAGDNIAKVEKLWNFSSKIDITKQVAGGINPEVQTARNVIDAQANEDALTGKINRTRVEFPTQKFN